MLDQVVITDETEVLFRGCEALDAELEDLQDYGITTAEQMLNLLVDLGNDEDDQAEEYRQTVRDLVKGARWRGVQVSAPAVAAKPSPQPEPQPAPTTDSGRRCAESGCGEHPLARRGSRGPHPKRCPEHTEARERAQRAGRVVTKPREDYPPCCVEAGNILCPQHEQQREFIRDWDTLPTEAEVDALDGMMGEEMWHVDRLPFKFHSGTGPDEGRTTGLRKQHDPAVLAEARQWISENADWNRGV